MYPRPIQRLIDHFQKLPGIGPKQAAKFSFKLLSMSIEETEGFAKDLANIKKEVSLCGVCFLSFEKDNDKLCLFCRDENRIQSKICVVETERDALTIEATKSFDGVYHVLSKRGPGPLTQESFSSQKLLRRLKTFPPEAEVILAMNATTDGQTTALWLERVLSATAIRVTRLGRGLSSCIEIEYADKDTLVDALKNRK